MFFIVDRITFRLPLQFCAVLHGSASEEEGDMSVSSGFALS